MKIIDAHTLAKDLIAAGFSEKQTTVLLDIFATQGITKGEWVYNGSLFAVAFISLIGLILNHFKSSTKLRKLSASTKPEGDDKHKV